MALVGPRSRFCSRQTQSSCGFTLPIDRRPLVSLSCKLIAGRMRQGLTENECLGEQKQIEPNDGPRFRKATGGFLSSSATTGGFTLTEMIGVLAVITLLAAMLIPRIIESIKRAHAVSIVRMIRSCESAVAQYIAQFGYFGGETGAPYRRSVRNWDEELVKLGILEKPLFFSSGVTIDLQVAKYDIREADGVVDCTDVSPSQIAPGYIKVTGDPDYDLDGDGDSDTANSTFVVQMVIADLSREIAKMINDAIDGEALGAPIGEADLKGRVKYKAAPRVRVTDVWIYLGHN